MVRNRESVIALIGILSLHTFSTPLEMTYTKCLQTFHKFGAKLPIIILFYNQQGKWFDRDISFQ
jgi:hypothetical protein